MRKKIGFLLIACCIGTAQIAGLCADNPSPEQLVALHLKSIGEPAALSGVKSMAFAGIYKVQFIMGGFGVQNGNAMLVSEGAKIAIDMDYGEYFAYDGKSVTVKNILPGQKSPLADFLSFYNKIMKNGLFGGVYSNAWPLLDIGRSEAGMNIRKTKVENVELYELEYRPKDHHGEMKICLYFAPETFRHMRTHYYVRTAVGFDVRPHLTEKFENFKKVGDLTLPHSYTLQLELERSSTITRWEIQASEWIFNRPNIDPRIFRVED